MRLTPPGEQRHGIELDLPDPDYRAHPALSQSGMKTLLDCPARFAWEREHGRPPKDAFDFGHIVHALVLGVGERIEIVDADSWRTKAAADTRTKARAEGRIAVLGKDYELAQAAADAVFAHPVASTVLEAKQAVEVSLFWQRDEIEVKGRVDIAATYADGRPVLVDLKTSMSAAPGSFAKSVYNYGYHLQSVVYRDGWRELTGDDADFLFIVVEKDRPNIVTVGGLDDLADERGRADYTRALDLYRACVESDTWPGYADNDLVTFRTPAWA